MQTEKQPRLRVRLFFAGIYVFLVGADSISAHHVRFGFPTDDPLSHFSRFCNFFQKSCIFIFILQDFS